MIGYVQYFNNNKTIHFKVIDKRNVKKLLYGKTNYGEKLAV